MIIHDIHLTPMIFDADSSFYYTYFQREKQSHSCPGKAVFLKRPKPEIKRTCKPGGDMLQYGIQAICSFHRVADRESVRRRIVRSQKIETMALYFLCTRKFRWNSLVHKKARPANDAHSRDEEVCRKRPRSARECAKAHSFSLFPSRTYQKAEKERKQRWNL